MTGYDQEYSRRILVNLLTDPHRSGKTIYFDPDSLSARLGGHAWDHLEAIVALSDVGLVKFYFTREVELLFRFLVTKVRMWHVLGIKDQDEIAFEMRKATTLGRAIGKEPVSRQDQRVPDHLEALKKLSTQLGKLLKLLDGKKLVSREVYEKVAASVLSDTVTCVQSTEAVLASLKAALTDLVEVMKVLVQERYRTAELRDKLGLNLEELDLILSSYSSGENDCRRLLQEADQLVRDAFPNWDDIMKSADRVRSEFAQKAPFLDMVLKQLTSINEMLVVLRQA
ncbi:MAG: hypothetical protein NZ957_06260 [Thaumarchaeota archaeon]|nr:hypothetical protein [Candidatus Calditenuaceae archaeon]MDW8042563.1 hypothetical protein [Nitrososphaerota archaeon]